ncbi:MAG: PP2C family protein-serine/threonine phosphatase [Candidatus Limnocylindria bacterium]
MAPTTDAATGERVRYAFASDVGRRREKNEDAVAVIAPESDQDWAFDLAAVVCDGVGGQPHGDMASRIAVEMLVQALSRKDGALLTNRLVRAIEAANEAVREFARRAADGAPLASTVVVAVLRERALTVAHVGDSRAYRLRGGKLDVLTLDHSVVQEQVRHGLLDAAAAKGHLLRSRLSRAVGSEEGITADVAEHRLQGGDVVLVCSDGLHAFVDETLVAAAIDDDLQASAQRLVTLANEAGGKDNCTVALLRTR